MSLFGSVALTGDQVKELNKKYELYEQMKEFGVKEKFDTFTNWSLESMSKSVEILKNFTEKHPSLRAAEDKTDSAPSGETRPKWDSKNPPEEIWMPKIDSKTKALLPFAARIQWGHIGKELYPIPTGLNLKVDTYYNNPLLQVQQEVLRLNPAYTDPILRQFGIVPISLDAISNTVQWNTVLGTSSTVRPSDLRDSYPESPDVKFGEYTSKALYFNQKLEWNMEQYSALLSGNPMMVAKLAEQSEAIAYAYQETLKIWFLNFGTAYAALPGIDNDWKPWFKKTAGTGSEEIPVDVNNLVTSDAGTTGTCGTTLDMGTVMRGTNKSVDFVSKTFGPVIEGVMANGIDSTTGKRILEGQDSTKMTDNMLLLMHPSTIQRLGREHPWNAVNTDYSIDYLSQVRALGFNVQPLTQFAYSAAEDGYCEFGVSFNPTQNFKIGVAENLNVEGFEKRMAGDRNYMAQFYHMRLAPYTKVYKIGSTYYKAFFHGKFKCFNDA